MLFELFPFQVSINASAIAGASLWSLALYLGLSQVVDWTTDALTRWFNFAERSLYISQKEFEETRSVRESVNRVYASLMSTVPFLVLGAIAYTLSKIYIGQNQAILVGMVGCSLGLLYEIGRDAGHSSL